MTLRTTSHAFCLSLALSGAALLAQGAPAAVPGSFADNPIVYFLMTDRFVNADPSNDGSYGRKREALPKDDVATFHGGDLKGVTRKLKEGWFRQLGVNALWITAPYEQIHGWVQGGKAEFKHYAYHGYYALDYTVLDGNMGTPADLKELIDTAHAQGIRVLFDIVMNHPGYLDLQTARELKVDVLFEGSEKATLKNYHNYIDYNSFKFLDWWGRDWVRAGLPGYLDGGRDDLTMQLAFLPDFRTESKDFVKLPKLLKNKPGT
ncbi:MAG: alpha-amylase, partial [Holophaga sp.]|nr:alpha-amylase [Holophaga sp.]